MALRFPYLSIPTNKPSASAPGLLVRHRPILAVRLFGPLGSQLIDGCLDSACDDTVFPRWVAKAVGVDLTGAATGQAHTPGGPVVPYHYARVKLRITDGAEQCEWETIVGFADLPMRWALLGHTGFLDFFDTELRGASQETVLTPNHLFPGQYVTNLTASP